MEKTRCNAFDEVNYNGHILLKFMADSCKHEIEDIEKYGEAYWNWNKSHITKHVNICLSIPREPEGVKFADYKPAFRKALKEIYANYAF